MLVSSLNAAVSLSMHFAVTAQENENLRSRVLQLESTLQQRAEQLSRLERQSEQDQWRRGEELRRRDERVKELQLELDKERSKEPIVKVTALYTALSITLIWCLWIEKMQKNMSTNN